MSRTPAMAALRRTAADHRTAAALCMPVGEYRDIRDEATADPTGPSRRTLIKRAGVVGIGLGLAGAGLSRPAIAAETGARPPVDPGRVVIVGAGIAGLTAALTLADAGVKSTVYEANPTRVGGRMYSQKTYWGGGQTSEVGGELIDTGHKKMLELCRRFGLATVDFAGSGPNGATETLWFDNAYYPRSQADDDFRAMYQAVRRDYQECGDVKWNRTTATGTAISNTNLRDWINSRTPGGSSSKLGQFLDVAYTVEYGAETVDQSAYAAVSMLGWQSNPGHFNIWGGSNERYHVVGGNDQVPLAIAAALPSGTVRMGHKLVAVRANSDGTQTLTFDANGTTTTVTADHTILAVPLPILKGLDSTRAGFDPMMTNLLRDSRMGHVSKLNMQFTKRTWLGVSGNGLGPWPGVAAGDSFADLPFQQTWDTTKGQPGTKGVLIQYGGGALASGLHPAGPFNTAEQDAYVANLANTYLGQIDNLFPGTKAQWTGKAQLSSWTNNPYSWGAYSYWPVGYLHRYAGYEGTRQGNVHISGEHTSYDFQGFMEGGATEGERAAREVLGVA
ncbi:flavin monoamine oxidase family protein [Embleya scabrispora]|uniref:flavin monoamine oxidase family protein n=1 Tax=Embleya scabrispora TaxID=159449 RepID=UPI00039DB6B4|nr:NAD(P)/FAD-dependent oxidoreductase [Embleya scabrispora]MYS86932.1 NAD(P)-binding protein [Streptomyces sp. SID5474]